VCTEKRERGVVEVEEKRESVLGWEVDENIKCTCSHFVPSSLVVI
jgi:hypothetical protein